MAGGGGTSFSSFYSNKSVPRVYRTGAFVPCVSFTAERYICLFFCSFEISLDDDSLASQIKPRPHPHPNDRTTDKTNRTTTTQRRDGRLSTHATHAHTHRQTDRQTILSHHHHTYLMLDDINERAGWGASHRHGDARTTDTLHCWFLPERKRA